MADDRSHGSMLSDHDQRLERIEAKIDHVSEVLVGEDGGNGIRSDVRSNTQALSDYPLREIYEKMNDLDQQMNRRIDRVHWFAAGVAMFAAWFLNYILGLGA